VLTQLDHLKTHPVAREQVDRGQLVLTGWWFDIGTGDMHSWQEQDRRFVLIDRLFAESLDRT